MQKFKPGDFITLTKLPADCTNRLPRGVTVNKIVGIVLEVGNQPGRGHAGPPYDMRITFVAILENSHYIETGWGVYIDDVKPTLIEDYKSNFKWVK